MSEYGNSEIATGDLHSMTVPAIADRLPALRHLLSDWASRVGLAPDQAEELTLAAYEAMVNVVEHAYSKENGTFDLLARLPEAGGVEVVVTDRGRWQPPADDPGPLQGRGLPLMRDLADDVELLPEEAGTIVRLRWSPRRS